MELEQLSASKILLPELKLIDTKVGGNNVLRFAVRKQQIDVAIYESEYKGWLELRTDKPFPYDRLYLQKPRIRNRVALHDQLMGLKLAKLCNIANIDETKKLLWMQHPAMGDVKQPDEIVSSWSGCFQFIEEKTILNQAGLRIPQLGALHAISAYFSVKKNQEPVTIVLPTGTGKTETMLSFMVYRQLSKVLVIVPSNALRGQIFDKFCGLGRLSDLGLVPVDVGLPAVVAIKAGIKSIAEAEELLLQANVFVATASVLNSSNQKAVDRFCAGIGNLFIDEAHHISAATWARVRDRFIGKRVIQFTATPFRNDGSALGGRIIYNYTMGEAQEADYFCHINFISIEEYYLEEADRAIAQSAIKQLRSDLENGYDHILMARVEKKTRADELLPLYKELAPDLNPIVVYSGMNRRDINSALSAMFNRKSRIVICVNMLGEGFDLPNLKVAAMHDIRKSLPITLQFIGRFTRYSPNLGDASVIVNTAEPEVETGLQRLYAQGADWDSVLKRLSEGRIEREVRLQEVVERLKEKGDLHRELSLWNLRPPCSAMLFKTTCDTWNPECFEEVIPVNTEQWYAISEEEKLLVVLAIYEAPVKWGNYKELRDSLYKLLIAHWDKSRSALFVYSNDYKWFRVEKIAKLLCDEQCELLSGPKIFNVFNGLKYPIVRNLGAAQVGAISFAQYFGSNVTEGLNRIESAKSTLSNLAGLGYDDGDKVIWGCSQKKGKIWSVSSGSIFDWTEWVKTAWDKVTSGDVDETNITRDFLRPKRITEPHSEHAIAIQWGEHIQADPEDRVMILFGDAEIPLYLVDLKIVQQGAKQPFHIAISSENLESVYEFTISENLNGGFSYQLLRGESVSIRRGSGTAKPLEEYLQSDPWIIQYVNGSLSYNCFLIEFPEAVGEFNAEQIECWDWSDTDITKESMGKECKTGTVQWKSFKQIEDQYDLIINDDGSGEAADLIGFKVVGDEINLALVHCKYSKLDEPGARINDLYEVSGQAQKSIRWKHAGISRLYGHIRRREERWRNDNASRFLKGSMSDLASLKRRARTAPVKLQVYIVQPGLKKDDVSEDMLRVLGSTSVYLKNTAQSELVVVGSEG